MFVMWIVSLCVWLIEKKRIPSSQNGPDGKKNDKGNKRNPHDMPPLTKSCSLVEPRSYTEGRKKHKTVKNKLDDNPQSNGVSPLTKRNKRNKVELPAEMRSLEFLKDRLKQTAEHFPQSMKESIESWEMFIAHFRETSR